MDPLNDNVTSLLNQSSDKFVADLWKDGMNHKSKSVMGFKGRNSYQNFLTAIPCWQHTSVNISIEEAELRNKNNVF